MRPLLLAVAVAAIACGSTSKEPAPRSRPTGLRAIAWRCQDVNLVFLPGEDHARLKIAEETRDLSVRVTPTGFQYFDDQVQFSMVDDQARFEIANVEQICLYDAVGSGFEDARVRGVAFRAVGPAWVVEIADRITLTRPDQAAVDVAAGTPTDTDGVLTWTGAADPHSLTVTATPSACFDRETGHASGWTVQVGLDGTSLQGCGERLDGIEVK